MPFYSLLQIICFKNMKMRMIVSFKSSCWWSNLDHINILKKIIALFKYKRIYTNSNPKPSVR